MTRKGRDRYSIGYGKPPAATRFSKGQSGNPTGRPRGTRNLATLLGQALNERVVYSENGRRRSITKLQATVKQLVNRAATGDPKFLHPLLTLVQLVECQDPVQAPEAELLTESDRKLIEGMLRGLRRKKASSRS